MPGLPPVPDCEGPQLQPYRVNGTPDITFLQRIGQGAHGHIFKVQIDDNIFALKVFNHQVLDPEWVTADDEEWDKIDDNLLTAQWHPFHAECRAYARLKETRREHLAVSCYGYVCLSESQKQELEDRFGINSWWDDDYDLETPIPDIRQKYQLEDRRCLRAIVKEFIDSDVPFAPHHAPMMIKDLHHLHRCGIVVHDLKEDAYVNGKLVDFSKAIVVPHILFDNCLRGNSDDTARSAVHEDLARLLLRFDEWNEEHVEGPKIECDPLQIADAVARLRRGPLTREELIARCFNPCHFKWQRFNKRIGTPATMENKCAISRNSGVKGKKPAGVSRRKSTAKHKRTWI